MDPGSPLDYEYLDDFEPEGDENRRFTEIQDIKTRVKDMEEEIDKLKKIHAQQDKNIGFYSVSPRAKTLQEIKEADSRSVYVGNVHYGATSDELLRHFKACGGIKRVTILRDKYTGHPKGFAYIEFADEDSVNLAIAMDGTLLCGRKIKVTQKRTNKPGIGPIRQGKLFTKSNAVSNNRVYRNVRASSKYRWVKPY